MKSSGIHRGYIINLNKQQPKVSHEIFNDLLSFVRTSPDYQQHEGIFWAIEPESESLFIVAVHDTHRGSAQGGTRMKQYNTTVGIFTDVMRLAKGMTDKNACAGIWWGGGKSVLHTPQHPRSIQGEARQHIFKQFGLFVASLNGVYVCAEDMNISPEDLRVVHAYNRFCTCVPAEIGGSSNPSSFTARGVFNGLMAAVHFTEGIDDIDAIDLKGKHILVQGAGNVGWVLIEEIVKAGGRVTVFDISERTKERLRNHFPPEQVTIEEDIDTFYSMNADVFAPCAIGAILNDDTIPNLNVKIIAGAANNQLKDPVRHAEMLHERGILYTPDFIINRIGIVNCANEQYGYLVDTIEEKIKEVYGDTLRLLQKASKEEESPELIAMQLADQLSQVDHPIWGHRGIKLIAQLEKNGWADAG